MGQNEHAQAAEQRRTALRDRRVQVAWSYDSISTAEQMASLQQLPAYLRDITANGIMVCNSLTELSPLRANLDQIL